MALNDLLPSLLSLLKKHGLRLDSDQVFIVDSRVLEREASHAFLSKKDTVLEIGAAPGFLTRVLAARCKKVYAVEKDDSFEPLLKETLGEAGNVELLFGDALEIELPRADKVVANLPYSVSSPLTFRLLEHGFDLAVLGFQKEFALRMVALPGGKNYGRLSVMTRFLSEPEFLETVPKSVFFPRPNVDSALVRLVPKETGGVDREAFSGLVREIFRYKNKTVRKALKHAGVSIEPGVFSDRRVRELDVGDLVRLLGGRVS